MQFKGRAFVLHRWPYRETSLLLDAFTECNGRIRLVAKGVRRQRSVVKSYLHPFIPLHIQWSGRGELKVLTNAEAIALPLPLTKNALYSGFYLNELLYRLLVFEEPQQLLFNLYLSSLCQLATEKQQAESILRCFELTLLQSIGYGIDFSHCAQDGSAIEDDATYCYRAEYGLVKAATSDPNNFKGYQLKAIADKKFTDFTVLREAKRFTRLVLKTHLGKRPLKSRELFVIHTKN